MTFRESSKTDRRRRFGWIALAFVATFSASWLLFSTEIDIDAVTEKWAGQHATLDSILGHDSDAWSEVEAVSAHPSPLAPDEDLQDQCGNWQLSYKTMHRAWLESDKATRDANPAIIYDCTGIYCSGLADRLLGMTSTFLIAVITGRPFFANWSPPLSLERLFDKVHIDWQAPEPVMAEAVPLIFTNLPQSELDQTLNLESWSHQTPTPMTLAQLVLVDKRHLKVYNNRGLILRSFHYPHIQSQLVSLGITHELAYQCFFNYLFKPNPEILSYVTRYAPLLERADTYTVGIHIRTGDIAMFNDNLDGEKMLDDWSYYFGCAHHIAETFARADQRINLFVITDSAVLKNAIANRWSENITLTDMKPGHIAANVDDHAAQLAVAHTALAELLLLAKTDARVISSASGFGKVSRLRDNPLGLH